VAREPGAAPAVLLLSYLVGGQALALSFAGFIGATSVVALRTNVLPRWIGRLGCATAGLCVLSVAWLIWEPAFSLLMLAAALGLLWLFVTSSPSYGRRSPTQDTRASGPPCDATRPKSGASRGQTSSSDIEPTVASAFA